MNRALELEKDCFACGQNNSIGLRMNFNWEEDRYVRSDYAQRISEL